MSCPDRVIQHIEMNPMRTRISAQARERIGAFASLTKQL
jgi:hypothetical protein